MSSRSPASSDSDDGFALDTEPLLETPLVELVLPELPERKPSKELASEAYPDRDEASPGAGADVAEVVAAAAADRVDRYHTTPAPTASTPIKMIASDDFIMSIPRTVILGVQIAGCRQS